MSYSDFAKVRDDLNTIADKNEKNGFLHSIFSGIGTIFSIIPNPAQAAIGTLSTVDGLVSFISSFKTDEKETALKQINDICAKISDFAMENNKAPDVDIKITTKREGVQEFIQGAVPIQNKYFAKYTDKITISVTLNGKTTNIPLQPVETNIGYSFVPMLPEKFPSLEDN